MVLSPMVGKSIILTGTQKTTTSQILSVFLQRNTEKDTPGSAQKKTGESLRSTHDQQLPNGMGQKKVLSSTQDSERNHGLAGKENTQLSVRNAGNRSNLFQTLLGTAFVPFIAIERWRIETAVILKRLFAVFARKNLTHQNTGQGKPVRVYVARVTESGKQDVYNLQVNEQPEFYANGILVHNCIWALTELFSRIVSPSGRKDIPRVEPWKPFDAEIGW